MIQTDEQAAEFYQGERMYLELAPKEEREEHLARYLLARDTFVTDWKCMDAACGSGYGSDLLAQKVMQVTGIDISEHAIKYARTNYQRSNLRFQCASLDGRLPLENESLDAIASFETLEHIRNQRGMLQEFHRVLRPNGVLVISTPDRDVLSGIESKNEFHVSELSKKEFVDLLGECFSIERLYGHVRHREVSRFWKVVHGLLRLVSRMDVLKLRDGVILKAGLHKNVCALRRRFWPMMPTPFEAVDSTGKSEHAYLVAVARKS